MHILTVFLNLVIKHRVAPIVYHNLVGETQISIELKQELQQLAEQNVLKTLASKEILIRIQRKFDENKLKGFFLKGIILADEYYGDISLRHTMDLDFWIEESGIFYMSNFLEGIGYKSNLAIGKLNKVQFQYIKRMDHDLQFLCSENSNIPAIELHWKVRGPLGSFSFDPIACFSKLKDHREANLSFRFFNNVDNFLYICTHGTEHGWYRMKWLFDLPQILDKSDFDWDIVLKRAEELNCQDHLLISFVVINDLIGEPIPRQILEKIQKRKIAGALDYIYSVIFSKKIPVETNKGKLMYLKFMLSQNKRGIINKDLFLKYLTSPSDWNILPLPGYLFFLYFPMRPFLFLWRKLFKN